MSELTVEKIILEISNSNEVVVLEVSSGGGDGGVSIDDNAGLGVIDKTWSANKIRVEIDSVAGVPLSMFNTLENTVYGVMTTADNNTQAIIDVNTRIDNIATADITQAMFDALESKVDINTAAIPNKVDKEEGKGLSSNDFSDEDKVKLGSVATGATANSTDDFLLDRGNHTGVQPIASVDGLQLALEVLEDDVSTLFDDKVDKDGTKQLSDENFTLIEKNKLLSIQEGAQANIVDSVAGKVGDVVLDKSDVGLPNVDNTSDLNKPISIPTQTALDNKVDKQAGKGLSDTNFTQAEKDKLSSLESSKFVGLFVSESALPLSGSEGDYANVDGGVGSDVYRVIWDSSDNKWVRVQGVSTELTNAQIKQQYESNPDTNAFTDDEKAKLDSVAEEATKNRADSENADKVHTHTTAQVTGLDTALDGKASNTDPRLTDAREWSAATVTQAEAEAGTASARRAWTAQRVRQAIAAWYLTVSTTFTRTLLGRSTAAQIRGDLELGTAATRDVGESSGNVMQVGAYGLGGIPPNTTNHLSGTVRFMRNGGSAQSNVPPGFTYGTIISVPYDADYNQSLSLSAQGRLFYSFKQGAEASVEHIELHTTGNILTTTGQSTQYPMTQKAVTDAINGVSDRRDKIDIAPNDVGLNLIEKLEPVSFKLNKRDWYRNQAATSFEAHTGEDGTQTESEKINPDVIAKPLTDYDANDGSLARDDTYTGLIAQDVKAALEDLGLGDLAIIKNYSDEYEGGDDRQYIEYNGLIPVMINAIKELSARVKELEDKD